MGKSAFIRYFEAILFACVVIAILVFTVLSTGLFGDIPGGIRTDNSTDSGEQNDRGHIKTQKGKG